MSAGTAVAVCPLAELPDGGVATVDAPGTGRIAVFHVRGALHAVEDRCSHQQAWLSDGFVDELDCIVECPLHASAFDLRTGAPIGPPAVAPVRVFPVLVVDGVVTVTVPAS
jgi:3-phenylpropionate/trans-cinnamate dioxygenase ferredoxin subunit